MANSVETFLGRITEETHTALLHSVISRRIPGIIPKEMYIEMSLEKKISRISSILETFMQRLLNEFLEKFQIFLDRSMNSLYFIPAVQVSFRSRIH